MNQECVLSSLVTDSFSFTDCIYLCCDAFAMYVVRRSEEMVLVCTVHNSHSCG